MENLVEQNPRKREYTGQRGAQEVFEELKHRLEGMGYLPDEYFLMDSHWENGREIPKDADIFCTTDYGGSEGVYLDVYLKWYDEQQKVAEMQAEFNRIATWSDIFDSSDIATKKMICGYIIKQVTVYRDYQLSVKFNITVEQFLTGIDNTAQENDDITVATA